MPIGTAGRPFSRASLSMFCAPSSIRATSRSRSTDPSGVARMTMAPNSAGVTSRPVVCRLNWNCWSLPIGRAPIRPTGATTFCASIAAMMSPGVRPRLTRRLVSNQMRIE